MAEILIVEDELSINELIRRNLNLTGHHCTQAFDGMSAAKLLENGKFDLLVLDIMLPGLDGYQVFEKASGTPTIFLTAKGELADKLKGLAMGADDYLTKPFLPRELILRISAIIRRTYLSGHSVQAEAFPLNLGTRTVHFDRGTVETPDGETAFTAKELLILKKLYENRGRIATFDTLCDAVWGDGYYTYENTLMVHIRRLREKLEEDPSRPRWLLTARGIGYRLAAPPS